MVDGVWICQSLRPGSRNVGPKTRSLKKKAEPQAHARVKSVYNDAIANGNHIRTVIIYDACDILHMATRRKCLSFPASRPELLRVLGK